MNKLSSQGNSNTVLRTEKRCRLRIPVDWFAVVQTPQGSIEGEAKDISVGGAFIRYSEEADLSSELRIVLKPSERKTILLTARKVWSGNFNIDGKAVFSGVGVRFTAISPEDREFISSLVSCYLNSTQPLTVD